jgi:DNA gyrase subunit A
MRKETEVINENIVDLNISEYCTELMKIFGANINIARHIPTLMDSLKPAERRLLYSMYLREGINKFKKVATIAASTMEMFHPHGDVSLQAVLARMVQPWNNHVPLIVGQGGFGSIAGDPPGAGR